TFPLPTTPIRARTGAGTVSVPPRLRCRSQRLSRALRPANKMPKSVVGSVAADVFEEDGQPAGRALGHLPSGRAERGTRSYRGDGVPTGSRPRAMHLSCGTA